MTSRSKRYFQWKTLWKNNRPLADLTRAINRGVIADIIAAMAPIPKYPPGTEHPEGRAIVGESGPEGVIVPDGKSFMTDSMLHRLELPINNLIHAREAADALRAGRARRPIVTNAPFTFIDLTGQPKPTI